MFKLLELLVKITKFIKRWLVPHSATRLLLKVVGDPVSLLSTFQVLILRLVPGDEFVQFLFECCLLITVLQCHVFMRRLFGKFHFLSQPPPSRQRLLDVVVLNLVLDLCSFLSSLRRETRCQPRLGASKSSHQVSAIMSFLHGSAFTFLGHLSMPRQDPQIDVFFSTLHGPSSFLLETCFSWKATPPTGIPQSSERRGVDK